MRRALSVWTLAWPSMALFALQSLVGVVDFLFVSSLGTQAIAGVGVAVQIQFLTFGLLEAVTTGTVALIAREIGTGRPFEAARAMRTALVLAAGFGALLMLAMPASDRIVSWMGVAPEVVSLGGRCLRILLGFGIPVSVGATLAMGLRGAGDVRTPLAIGIVTNLVNVFACWALIFGRFGAPALGAEGSVWASGIAFVTGALLFLWLWGRGDLVLPTAPWRGNVTRRAGAAPAARGHSDGARARRVPARAAALPAHRRGLRDGADLGVSDRCTHPGVLLRAGLRLRERRRDARRPESRRRATGRGRALGLARDRRRRGRDEQRRARDHPARAVRSRARSARWARRRSASP